MAGLSRGITAVKQRPPVALGTDTTGAGVVEGGWAGSEKLSGLDILTVACIRKNQQENC